MDIMGRYCIRMNCIQWYKATFSSNSLEEEGTLGNCTKIVLFQVPSFSELFLIITVYVIIIIIIDYYLYYC